MKEKLLSYLACPRCGGELRLRNEVREGSEIMEGELVAACCGAAYRVLRGVPRFVDFATLESDKLETAQNFGWEWRHFTDEDPRYSEQFLAWLRPVQPSFFEGKTVLEGGCGKGRHTRLAARWGAKDVVSVDLSEAVETAFPATRSLENVHIVQGDIFALPVRRAFDYAFSVGVLHHLPDPRKGFLSLAAKVKPGGHISAWVYGAENNGWITNFISPLRERLTSKIDQETLLQLSKVPAAAVFLANKLVYRPISKGPLASLVGPHLFYNDYLVAISGFGFREHHHIVFDHLVAPTAFYIKRDDFEAWWRELGAKNVAVSWTNKNSWSGFGQIPDA